MVNKHGLNYITISFAAIRGKVDETLPHFRVCHSADSIASNKNITYLRTLSNKLMQLVIPNLWRIPDKIFIAVIVAKKKVFGRSNTS